MSPCISLFLITFPFLSHILLFLTHLLVSHFGMGLPLIVWITNVVLNYMEGWIEEFVKYVKVQIYGNKNVFIFQRSLVLGLYSWSKAARVYQYLPNYKIISISLNGHLFPQLHPRLNIISCKPATFSRYEITIIHGSKPGE